MNSWLNLILSVILVICVFISIVINLLRFIHNRMPRRDKSDAVGEVTVPRRIITIPAKRYESGTDLFRLCGIYLEEYLK